MDATSAFGPATRAWFAESFAAPTEVQVRGWAPITAGSHALLLAPTGSGKTLAAFLSCIDRLVHRPEPGPKGVRVLYVSPLKALAYDVERNLRAPLAGVRRTAERLGLTIHPPEVDVRTGDTSAEERRRQQRHPAEILVTTPESLFLILTSAARDVLRTVDTVIVDEIHVLAATKRGVHLALSLERLAALTEGDPQRIGLSATQRPLELVARYLGGDRPVSIVDASARPRLQLEVVVPVDDMENPPRPPEREAALSRRFGTPILEEEDEDAPFARVPRVPQPVEHGIWPSVYPALLERIRAHRSTIVFTNSRLLCERIAQKLNELAGEELVLAHHGSISHKRRSEIEEKLKAGQLPALIATSSLELGIDMGAVDQVLMVESPGAASRGLQRVGRAGHGVGEVSIGRVFPKYRGDLLEAAVVARAMLAGEIESTRMPTNCVDVLAQQVVAMVAMEPLEVGEIEAIVRRAAPFAGLSREALGAVLDMLSGRYPSDELADLTPRLNWDRATDRLTPRKSARTLAVMNAGTIPDRGLFRVQIAPDGPRLGELDEEMVYETREGDTVILGASSWRVEGVERDRVLVVPAPGAPGRLPFWKGERPGRPVELGRALGAFVGELDAVVEGERDAWLEARTPLDVRARKNLLAYLAEQKAATGCVPTDRAITVERFRDELGDWRVCILSPFGARVHAPWALALQAELSGRAGFDVQVLHSDDGIALRLVDAEQGPDVDALFPAAEQVEDLVVEQLGHSALFASRFRENAARALLLPRRRFTGRTPLWLQRRRSEALLGVARKYASFPIVLETYRECLQDVFDVPALVELLRGVADRRVRVDDVETQSASPFARSLVFQYVAAFMYEGDAPLAERRAHALTLDREMLRDLLGQEALRELIDRDSLEEVEAELQWLDGGRHLDTEDAVHDLLRRLGDLSDQELEARVGASAAPLVEALVRARRALRIRLAGTERVIAVEDAARYRDALGAVLPPGLPAVFLERAEAPLPGLLARWARTHGPFEAEPVAARWGLPVPAVEALLQAMVARGALVHGELRPGGARAEWCDPEVLRRLKRRALARLRDEVAPVEPDALARFVLDWHQVHPRPRRRPSLESVVDQLEGLPIPFSALERELLPARLDGFEPRMLDELGALGTLVWIGCGALGTRDGKITLYRRERVPLLVDVPTEAIAELDPVARAVLAHVEARGASFFVELQRAIEGATAEDVLHALWRLVWAGLITNDTFGPLRGLTARGRRDARSRMVGGRWAAVSSLVGAPPSPTERTHARVVALLERYGLVAREAAVAGEVPGGYSAIYPVLRAMEEAGKIRRGLFVDGLGGAQFALAGVVDRLRAHRDTDDTPVVLSAVDPACAWGALLPWPEAQGEARPRRVPGARVVLIDGRPVLYLEQGGRSLVTFVDPKEESARLARAVEALKRAVRGKALWITRVDGRPAVGSPTTAALVEAGFELDHRGLEL